MLCLGLGEGCKRHLVKTLHFVSVAYFYISCLNTDIFFVIVYLSDIQKCMGFFFILSCVCIYLSVICCYERLERVYYVFFKPASWMSQSSGKGEGRVNSQDSTTLYSVQSRKM